VTLKDVQGMPRHTRAETTADVYAQIIDIAGLLRRAKQR
jgi:hypothetical protein